LLLPSKSQQVELLQDITERH